ncbi:unnamed protein product, partial [Phaeothamnion confervicola]
GGPRRGGDGGYGGHGGHGGGGGHAESHSVGYGGRTGGHGGGGHAGGGGGGVNYGVRNGPFAPEEDDAIMRALSEGITKWSQIAVRLQGRTSKQVRERYRNHLDPTLVRTPWTREEDRILERCQREMGNRWTDMQTFLPGRSENAIKNRWNAAGGPARRAQERAAAAKAVGGGRILVVGSGSDGGGAAQQAPNGADGAVTYTSAKMEAVAMPTVNGRGGRGRGAGEGPPKKRGRLVAKNAPAG